MSRLGYIGYFVNLIIVTVMAACSNAEGRTNVTLNGDQIPNTVASPAESASGDLMVTIEFHYPARDVQEVSVAWGINGWNILDDDMLSSDTYIQDLVMHNPMLLDGDTFKAHVSVPAGAVVDYGFLITRGGSGDAVEIWEGDYQADTAAYELVDSQSPLILRQGAAPENGEALFSTSCSICHGPDGQGVAGLGKDLTTSEFVAGLSDHELVNFIISGRDANDPLNTTGVTMPPLGGNSALSEEDLFDIVAYIRRLNTQAVSSTGDTVVTTGDQSSPAVINGFVISVYGAIPDKYLTTLEFGPDGVLYVCSYDGVVWAIPDGDGDGVGDEPQVFAEGLEKPVGLEWYKGDLYVASAGEINALSDSDGDHRADETRQVISGLPAGIQPVHANNDLTIGSDGRLYFGIGSTSDSSSPTQAFEASILSINPDGSDLRVVATGVRNAYDVAFNKDGALFAPDNAPDGEAIASTLPPDELNHILEGGDYGFPDYYGPPPVDTGTTGPILNFPVHSARRVSSSMMPGNFPRNIMEMPSLRYGTSHKYIG